MQRVADAYKVKTRTLRRARKAAAPENAASAIAGRIMLVTQDLTVANPVRAIRKGPDKQIPNRIALRALPEANRTVSLTLDPRPAFAPGLIGLSLSLA